MRIIVAETAGFCWGVQRAIDTALEVSKSTGHPVYTYGPLIHNKQVVDELKKRNITDLEGDIEDASDGSLVIRAHGVRPDLRAEIESRHPNVIDATCPLVTKVHRKIVQNQEAGYRIYIMGDKNHPEVIGLAGSAKDEAVVIPADPEAVRKLNIKEDKACLVSQTTQNYEIFQQVADVLSEGCKELLTVNTICEPTRSHQMETADISSRVDTVVVVGGKHSANTKHLAELAARMGPRVIHVETDAELNAADFRNVQVVGVTAGASTPQWMIRRVVDRLRSFDGRSGVLMGLLRAAIEILVPTNLHTVFAFASLYLALSLLAAIPPVWNVFFAVLGIIFSIHTINEFAAEPGFDRKSRLSPAAYERFRNYMLSASFITLAVSSGYLIRESLAGTVNWWITVTALVAGIGGAVFSWKLVPMKFMRYTGFRSIRDIPGSKDLAVSFGWTLLLGVIPPLSSSMEAGLTEYAVMVVLIFLLVYRRSAIMAVRDVQGDRIVGMESSFKFLGKTASRRLLWMADILSLILGGAVLAFSEVSWLLGFLTVTGLLFGLALSFMYRFRRLPPGSAGQFIMDLQFVVPGLTGLILNFTGITV